MTAALLFQVEFLQFYAYCFETLQMFWYGLKMCISFGYYAQIIFCYFFTSSVKLLFRHLLLSK